MSDKLHAPPVLPPEKEFRFTLNMRLCGTPEPV